MISKHQAVVRVILVATTFIFGAASVAQAETFCPEDGERFYANEKFCTSHGVALKTVSGESTSKNRISKPTETKKQQPPQANPEEAFALADQALTVLYTDRRRAVRLYEDAVAAGLSGRALGYANLYIETVDDAFASVMIREGGSVDKVYLYNEESEQVPLDFEIKCEKVEVDVSGVLVHVAVKIEKDGQEVLSKLISNEPEVIRYDGHTIFPASYNMIEDAYVITLVNKTSGINKKFFVAPGRQIKWPEEDLSFGIVNSHTNDENQTSFKIWLDDKDKKPVEFWVGNREKVVVERNTNDYSFELRPLYYAGLQVAIPAGNFNN